MAVSLALWISPARSVPASPPPPGICQPSYVLAPDPDPASHCTFIFNTFLKFIWLCLITLAVAHRIFLVVAGRIFSCGMLVPWSKDGTRVPCIGNIESEPLDTREVLLIFGSEHLHCKAVVRGLLLCWSLRANEPTWGQKRCNFYIKSESDFSIQKLEWEELSKA